MSIIYSLPSDISSLSKPSPEWTGLLESTKPPKSIQFTNIPEVRQKFDKLTSTYHQSQPQYLKETNVLVSDKTYTSGSSTLPIRIYTPYDTTTSETTTYPILLWFHGGGFAIGNNKNDDELLRYMSHTTKIIIASAGYRLSPEHKFPSAPEDAWAASLWIRDNAEALHASPSSKGYYVGGMSAGGNLACVVSRRARDYYNNESIKIDGQLLGFPWLCSYRGHKGFPETLTGFTSLEENKDSPILGLENLVSLEMAVGSPGAEDFSPLHDLGRLKGLPRAVVFVAGADTLRDDGIAYWKGLARDGFNPRLRIFPGMPHAFYLRKEMKSSREFKVHLQEGMRELIELRNQRSAL